MQYGVKVVGVVDDYTIPARKCALQEAAPIVSAIHNFRSGLNRVYFVAAMVLLHKYSKHNYVLLKE